MVGAIALLVIMAFVFWLLAVIFYWRFINKKRKIMSNLGVESHRAKEKPFGTKIIELIIRAGTKFAPVGSRLTFLVKDKRIERYLNLAGNPFNLRPATFLGVCFVLGVLGVLTGNILSFVGFPLSGLLQLLLLLIGFLGPMAWLRLKANNRQETIGLGLPDYLDAISITLHAGVSLESAMAYVAAQTVGPLGCELALLQKEIELGIPKDEAYSRLSKRNSSEQLDTLVSSLIQGSKLGVPVATTFKILAEDTRIARINRLKEKAGQASPKVTLITSFVILPAVLLAIFGLLVLNLIYNPQGIGLNGLIFS